MTKVIGVLLAVIVLLPSAQAANRKFAKYKRIEAYEIRPGILMLPTYSPDGQVCEIGLEVLHYSPQSVWLDSSMSRKEIVQIFHELVPAKERGPRSKAYSGDYTVEAGGVQATISNYKNVVLKVYGRVAPTEGYGEPTVPNLVATIQWNHRKCR